MPPCRFLNPAGIGVFGNPVRIAFVWPARSCALSWTLRPNPLSRGKLHRRQKLSPASSTGGFRQKGLGPAPVDQAALCSSPGGRRSGANPQIKPPLQNNRATNPTPSSRASQMPHMHNQLWSRQASLNGQRWWNGQTGFGMGRPPGTPVSDSAIFPAGAMRSVRTLRNPLSYWIHLRPPGGLDRRR
jgi:hypothetical protein